MKIVHEYSHMTIKYKVILTEEEREKLKEIVDKGKRKKINRLHSQILLNIDQGKEGKNKEPRRKQRGIVQNNRS